MKKIFKSAIALIMSVCIAATSVVFVHAEDAPPVDIKAKAAVLMDADSGKILINYNENEKLYPASVTKIMAILLVAEAIDNGTVKLSEQKVAVIGSGMTGLETAELLTEQGNSVCIVEMADPLFPGGWMQHLDDIKPRLDKKGTEYYTSHKLLEIKDCYIVTEDYCRLGISKHEKRDHVYA